MDRPLADLSPKEKRALLAEQVRQRAAQTDAPRHFPLSFAQMRLWFLDRMEGGSPFYNVSFATRLTGPLHLEALRRSISEIVRRHDTLRSSFVTADEDPVQVAASYADVPLPVQDVRHLPAQEREREAHSLLTEEAQRPFDLAQAPLVRTLIIRLDEEEHLLLVTMHHIIADGWSFHLFHGELQTLYSAFVAGNPSPLPELPIQYGDYAVWQRKRLQGEILQAQLEYWMRQIRGAPPLLELPADRPRPARQTYRGATQSITLPPELVHELEHLSKQEGVTFFMTLLAAFDALIYRYTGQTDVVVGAPIAGRTRREVEGLIGFFANTLLFRADLGGEPTFRELLARVKEVALGAYDHQDLQFERLVEEAQPERNLSYNPLFQVMFGLENTPREIREQSGLVFDTALFESGTSIVDLSLTIIDTPQGTQAQAEYSTDLFDRDTITRLLGHYRTLLEAVARDPQTPVSQLPILTESERRTLLVEWNDTRNDYPRELCVHQLFAAQANRTPDKVALVYGKQKLTYRELSERANKLAHYLRTLGVGPDTLVGICVERSIEMVVGVLGVLKAGGAYVPLDPTYPKERLAYMVEDSGAGVLLSQEELAGLAQDLAGQRAHRVLLDRDWKGIEPQPAGDPAPEGGPDNLAYVIYTSGSTGRPKGVQVPHRALTNHLWSMKAKPGLAEDDVLLAVTSLSFDIAALELYLPLVTGATLVLASKDIASDGILLGREIAERGATVMQGTPASWRLLFIADAWPARATGTLKALCGGEALPVSLAYDLSCRAVAVWNMYGPTETCIWSTIHKVEIGEQKGPNSSVTSIGRPIANTQVYLLDRHMQPVPIGVAGELYIGGDGLARGYLGRPDLTAERFVPNPFSNAEFGVRNAESASNPYSAGSWATPNSGTPHSGERLYKTGDLARYLPDGRIEFLGRIDQQVKVRGFRIELGEIEAVLGQHPALREAVVSVRGRESDDKRLVAYVVAHPGQAPSSTELRNLLRARLPEYMIPSTFVLLDKMPLTPNGKVDRKALPEPEGCEECRGDLYVVPRTPLEAQLAAVWAGVLKKERFGVTDNFFDLGGHSLSAMRMVSRVRTALSIDVALRTLFEAPTIEGLALAIMRAQGGAGTTLVAPRIVHLIPEPDEEEAPLNIGELSAEEIDSLLKTL
ncbi:MAG TPA: amino acid adenylation domain-containing protein [Chloroflexia bacterium]|nr:amino acid adenylation domain-containing protein [Chloroflexia bacterium]